MAPKIGQSKTALITGSSGGIGYELALQFAQDGYQLILVARNREKLEVLAKKITETHHVEVMVFDTDLSEHSAPLQLYEAITSLNIQVDVLVNNAGFGMYGPFQHTDAVREISMIDLNVRTLTQLTKLFLPEMLQRKSGGILNVASTAAFQPGPMMAVYCATKAYVLSFTEALANEVRGSGVTVCALCPGGTKTDFAARSAVGFDRPIHFERAENMMMQASEVAIIALNGFKKGQRVIIPGGVNRVLSLLPRILPRDWTTHMMRKFADALLT